MIYIKPKSEQNHPDNFPSNDSIEELESKEKEAVAVKLKKQLLRGSSEKIMITNKFKKNPGDIWVWIVLQSVKILIFIKMETKTNRAGDQNWVWS